MNDLLLLTDTLLCHYGKKPLPVLMTQKIFSAFKLCAQILAFDGLVRASSTQGKSHCVVGRTSNKLILNVRHVVNDILISKFVDSVTS